ncbi:hypothetical protein K504DRAFT_419541 [Pleomassaria siparia CBS 279.74]|uniref:DUF4048 domain-containing protein n=1 Tax=Pleomassaria siparia CBS 279.74 TaxID=1314801 RepID=A0A6G1JRF8_9PLEO|nr:hypothetical protein K504DRAFT_419541 [Pleomassaria siparia CBS 279.74]
MGSCAPCPSLLKVWISWVKGGLLLRILGLPAVLLALHLEIYGSSPRNTSLILHRLSKRFRLSRLACQFDQNHEHIEHINQHHDTSVAAATIIYTQQQKKKRTVMPPASSRPTPKTSNLSSPKRSKTPDNKQRSRRPVVTRSSKRLSLQFPIQPSPNLTPKLRPQSWVAAPSPMSPTVADVSPTETNLLAILAAQERYVLELKEELKKAEEDLGTLKKHWANNEFLKQRNDSRKVTQLQPLNTTLANLKVDSEDDTGSPAWVQRETDRRKALHSGQKITNRKVFSGSRHLRTLSLLSPDTLAANYQPSFPHPHDIRDGIDESITRTHTLIRHATTPDMAKHMSETQTDDQFELGVSTAQREAIVRTSKKLATDFKDGLFSFIDDIRQATVGDEASDGLVSPSGKAPTTKTARKVSEGRPGLNRATSSKKSSQKVDAIADDFWKEHGLIETKAVPTAKKTHTTKTARTPQKPSKDLEELEDWDNWDTPNDKYTKVAEHHSSDSEESSSPVSGLSSSRTSTRYHSQRHDSKASSLTSISSSGPAEDIVLRENTKRNSLQWPDLVKFSPTNLKRTASHLMKEWEQSLTPPPESRVSDHSSGDYVGRSTTPPDLL